MLNEDEWELIEPLLQSDLKAIQTLRAEKRLSLREALNQCESQACERFYELFGFRKSNRDAIWHHGLPLHGGECASCDIY